MYLHRFLKIYDLVDAFVMPSEFMNPDPSLKIGVVSQLGIIRAENALSHSPDSSTRKHYKHT